MYFSLRCFLLRWTFTFIFVLMTRPTFAGFLFMPVVFLWCFHAVLFTYFVYLCASFVWFGYMLDCAQRHLFSLLLCLSFSLFVCTSPLRSASLQPAGIPMVRLRPPVFCSALPRCSCFYAAPFPCFPSVSFHSLPISPYRHYCYM